MNGTDIHLSAFWISMIGVLVVWDIVWKGIALWHAARHNQMVWFVVILIINSAGILPIIYLLLHRGETAKD